jgi:outer membrane protein assembly factor BamB
LAADQPQWGERFTRNMVSAEKGLPDTFDPATGKNVKWVAKLGTETHGSPIVAGGRVLIGTNNESPRNPRHQGDRGVLLCLDEKDGSFLWQLIVPKIEVGNPPDIYLDWPRAGLCSPASVEGDRVYILSNRAEVMCLGLFGMANGNQGPFMEEGRHMAPKDAPSMEVQKQDADILWMFDLVKGTGIWTHDAAHSSILIDGPILYLNTGNGVDNTHRRVRAPDAPLLVAIEKATGRFLARDDLKLGDRIVHCTWSSPSLGEVGGRKLLFFGGPDGIVYAFEALAAAPPEGKVETLKEVWRFDCDPTAPHEKTHTYMTNRHEGPSNIKGMPVFYKDRVYVAAGGDIWWGKTQAWLKCIDATKTGDVTTTAEVWSYPVKTHCCSTPSIYNGMVFITDCGGLIHCVDAETGRPFWTHETHGEFWGSTLVADGKVYAANRSGTVTILAAEKEKKVLATVKLDGPISGTPTAANGTIYIGTYNNLYAITNK